MLIVQLNEFFDINRFFDYFGAPDNCESSPLNDETQNRYFLAMAILLCSS